MQWKGRDEKHLRSKYEDHSQKFSDWVNRIGWERSFMGRLVLHLEERFFLKRFAFVFLFCLLLAWTIKFEVHSDIEYDLGDMVAQDVYSPSSFEMVDEITTEEKRLRAEALIPLIYDYDSQVFEKVSTSVYKAFREMRAEMKLLKWPTSAVAREEMVKEFFSRKSQFEKTLGTNVPDYLFEWLAENRFSARLENVVIRNLSVWYQNKIVENVDKALPTAPSSLLARTVQKNNRGAEFKLKRDEIVDSTSLEIFNLQDLRGLDRRQLKEKENLETLARLLIEPNLTLNKQELETRRQKARDSVLPTTLSVKKNQILIGKGTVIQPQHQALLKKLDDLRSESRHEVVVLSIALLLLMLVMVFFQYLRRFTQGKVKVETKDIFVMGLITLFVVIVTKAFVFLTETAFLSKLGGAIPVEIFLFAAPLAAGPMLVGLLITSGEVVWLFTAFMALVTGLMSDLNFGLMIMSLAGGIAAARGVYACKKRNDIYWAGVRTGVVNALVVALLLVVGKVENQTFIPSLLAAVPAAFMGGIFASLLAMMAIPFLESVFNYTTDVKLLELSNLNHPLLKEMIVKAPGTYHHSMLVGSMVEAAAEEIGANPLLGKVMCYYHDIGKMEHSNYFIENQKPGQNPHDHISPYLSKTLLVAHVKDGVELGMEHKLGKPIIDGVLQHHGTTLISFFYNKALDQRAEDEPEVAEDEFRYPGPKPQFREAALCMLADSIEAAARSLDEPTPGRLQNIVRNIVQRKFMEGQLDECSLTLKDLSKVEQAFTRILLGIYHQRIDYPKSAGGGASEKPVQTLFTPGRS